MIDLALLRDVSRSFYLTLRLLPSRVRSQIGLAYLLARASDTIADTDCALVPERLGALGRLRERVLGGNRGPLDLGEFKAGQTAGEALLLARVEGICRMLEDVEESDRGRIRAVLNTIISGQELDLKRFGARAGEGITALETDLELDDYTYRVAGCVGEFWTRVCRAHLFSEVKLDEGRLMADAVRFGKGLQLTNILRDVPADLRLGRCYIPSERLRAVGLEASDLLDPSVMPRFRPLYEEYLDRAAANLEAGWNYTLMVPYGCWRVRLACSLPVLIGVKTLQRLRSGNVLDSSVRIKLSRSAVRGLLFQSVVLYPVPALWRGLWRRAAVLPRGERI